MPLSQLFALGTSVGAVVSMLVLFVLLSSSGTGGFALQPLDQPVA